MYYSDLQYSNILKMQKNKISLTIPGDKYESIMLRNVWKILLEDTQHLNTTVLYNFMKVVLNKLF